MSSTVWDKFYWSDWANDPKLKLCSMAAQGFWMRLLCIAAESEPKGFVAIGKNGLTTEQIATVTGCAIADVKGWVAELEGWGVFSRTGKGTIYSRKMVREGKKSKKCSENGKKGMAARYAQNPENKDKFQPPYNDGYNENLTPETRNQKPEARITLQEGSPKQTVGVSDATPRKKAPKPKVPASEAEEFFDREFWPVYPERDGDRKKAGAKKLCIAALAKGVTREQIMIAVRRYREEAERKGHVGTPYVQQATTWFNAKPWEENGEQRHSPNVHPFPIRNSRQMQAQHVREAIHEFANQFAGHGANEAQPFDVDGEYSVENPLPPALLPR